MKEIIIECNNVSKKIGRKQILNNISFDVSRGDILAFIGPNGAGKTTTIKLMLGLQKISNGTITINGYDVKKDFINAIRKVGAIVENPDMYMYLSGYDNLKMAAKLCKTYNKENIDNIVKKIGLGKRINDKVSKYSLGMRQRLGIGMSLVNNPNVLILDEPTNGLDPEGIKDLRNLLKSLAKEGMAIFISSHNLAELESFCNKVIIIQNGVVLEEKDVNDFKKISQDHQYVIKVNDTKKISKKYEIRSDNEILIKGDEEDVAKAVKDLVGKDIKIYRIYELQLSLEEAFLNKTGGNSID